MATWKNNSFLLGTAVFTLYMVYSGQRFARRKRGEAAWRRHLDDALLAFGLIGALGLLLIGVPSLLQGILGMNIVSVVFGTVTGAFVLRDLRMRLKDQGYDRRENLLLHIGRMGGGYIATFTAFLVTNVYLEPAWVLWLAPTAIGSALIAVASRRWRQKLYPKGKGTRQTIPAEAG